MREFKDLKIAVAGTGYVGLSIATLLSQHHKVTAVDIIPEKVELINNKKSPIQDEYIEKYLAEKELDLTATLDAKEAYSDADFVVIAAPTNYDSKKNFFDTSAVEAVIKLVIEYNPEAIMVIKSTIPVGYTASVREKFHCDNIIFSPEFLRESKALYDNLYPSRIIVGTDVDNARLVKAAHTFAELLQEGAIKENIDTLFMGFTEAEAVKAIDLIIHNGRVGEVYNVGGHNEKQNIEIVKIICKELGKPESLITHVGDRKGHDMRYAIDPTKIHNELGWLPETKFEDGIKKTIQWYLDNREWWETIISGEYQNYYEKMYSNR
ncbi:hypothetical protein DWX49_10585 [Blautia sp. AF19-34]|nr:hypothetical protein DWX49_10585 [Blautia sp. AF19-34]